MWCWRQNQCIHTPHTLCTHMYIFTPWNIYTHIHPTSIIHMYPYTHIHTYTYTHMHVHTHIHTHTCTHTYMHSYMYTHASQCRNCIWYFKCILHLKQTHQKLNIKHKFNTALKRNRKEYCSCNWSTKKPSDLWLKSPEVIKESNEMLNFIENETNTIVSHKSHHVFAHTSEQATRNKWNRTADSSQTWGVCQGISLEPVTSYCVLTLMGEGWGKDRWGQREAKVPFQQESILAIMALIHLV